MTPRNESDAQLTRRIAALKEQVDVSIAEGLQARTLSLLERLWRLKPGPSTAAFIAGRVGRLADFVPSRTARMAIARSFTVEPLVPLAKSASLVHGVDLQIDVGGFNNFAQDLLDPRSFVGAAEYDLVVVAVQTRDVAPELWEYEEQSAVSDHGGVRDRVISEMCTMLTSFRERNSAHVVLHGLERPVWPTLGLADDGSLTGQTAVVDEINLELRRFASEHAGIHFMDYDRLIASAGRLNWHDEEKWSSMRMPLHSSSMAAVANAWIRFLFPVIGHVAKALVVDLDNTLWGGVVGEVGADGVELADTGAGAGYLALQQSILDLHARGVLLGICSKNNESDAIEVLEGHPAMRLRPQHFSAVYANWESKAVNLKRIADDLNIGLDAIAFLDDNPAECELIRRELPEVAVIELDRPPRINAHPLLDHPMFERLRLSDEDHRRNQMYAEQRDRRELQTSTASLEDYLDSLETVVGVAVIDESDVTRVAQLTQKTNQFNLTTRRYTEQDVSSMMSDPTFEVYAARAADRFGDHGLIGVVVVKKSRESWEIDTFLLSCRVIGRRVESAMLAVVASAGRRANADRISGQFIPTPKNEPASAFFDAHGFTSMGDAEGRWTLSLHDQLPQVPQWIQLRTASGDPHE